MSEATLNGTACMSLLLVLPFSGIWHADATLTQDVDASGPQVLMLAGAVYVGAIVRSVSFAGRLMVRLVGGTGGWRTVIPAKQYSSLAGVPTVTVLADAATAASELPPAVDASVPPILGTAWVRPNAMASVTLRQVLGSAWWLDPSGVVQTAPRPATAIASAFDILDVFGSQGIASIATEFPGDWVPGRTFSSPSASGTIGRVMHRVEGAKLRTEVMLA